jgi:pyruvate dehydrogenase E1 component alpha subunit
VTAIDMPQARALALLEQMVLVRAFEERCAEVYSDQKIRGFLHLYVGEEAVAVGALAALRPEDNVVATYREHGHALLRGITPASAMAEMYGKSTGCSRGRGGSMHLFCTSSRFFGGHAIVGGGLPVAVGLALADSMQERTAVTACFFGDGATDEGEYHESLNLAALWKLPVLFLCENNRYAMGTALDRHEADTDLTHGPMAHGIASDRVDGMDVVAVERAVRYAADTVRESGEPRFLELATYRFRAHSMYDAEKYRSKEEVLAWKARDPIVLFEAKLRAVGYAEEGTLADIEERCRAQVDAAVEEAKKGPLEPIEDLEKDVCVRPSPRETKP